MAPETTRFDIGRIDRVTGAHAEYQNQLGQVLPRTQRIGLASKKKTLHPSEQDSERVTQARALSLGHCRADVRAV